MEVLLLRFGLVVGVVEASLLDTTVVVVDLPGA